MILSGIGTHIYNEKQEKIMKAEMERERRLLGYADPDADDDEEEQLLHDDGGSGVESELGEIVREVALLSGDSGAEGDDERAESRDTTSPLQHRVNTVRNM